MKNIACALSQVVVELSDCDPAVALAAVCEVAAELIKIGGSKQDDVKSAFIANLDKFLTLPNSLIDSDDVMRH